MSDVTQYISDAAQAAQMDALDQAPATNRLDLATKVVAILRSSPTYNAVNTAEPSRPVRVAVSQYEKAFLVMTGKKFGSIPPLYIFGSKVNDGMETNAEISQSQSTFRSLLTPFELGLAVVQDAITARDRSQDNGFIKNSDLTLAAQVTQAAGIIAVTAGVGSGIAASIAASGAAAGAATEAGTLAGSTGLLSGGSTVGATVLEAGSVAAPTLGVSTEVVAGGGLLSTIAADVATAAGTVATTAGVNAVKNLISKPPDTQTANPVATNTNINSNSNTKVGAVLAILGGLLWALI